MATEVLDRFQYAYAREFTVELGEADELGLGGWTDWYPGYDSCDPRGYSPRDDPVELATVYGHESQRGLLFSWAGDEPRMFSPEALEARLARLLVPRQLWHVTYHHTEMWVDVQMEPVDYADLG